MPGSSLWLVPSQDSALYEAIQELITNHIPALFPNTSPPDFFPHITLTSDALLEDGTDPQEWLDGLSLPSQSKLEIWIREVEVGSIFFKKVTMRCDKSPELKALAAACRQAAVKGVGSEAAREWAEEKYMPHCSLMYSELDSAEVQSRKSDVVKAVEKHVVSSQEDNQPIGEVWVVPTYRPLSDWKPVARRRLDNVRWIWN
ncbi:2, 3 cyclic phosphodiesterase [Polychaeton citri CBS 116435]|uniref:2, 3 cyclic phosphodiesterase n=1 Tax=Polychaeton citri CBS 116435 TaxID=1314669 RepID=A0A9P4Q8I4_9PEZI|nr:2, 3 cyclic phosphodiesterase [Polychaeton citri CBS 116435]